MKSTLFEVYYQDQPDSEVEVEVVFSKVEAEEAVLDFYNCLVKQHFSESMHPLEGFEEIALFQQQYSRQIQGKAWFKEVKEDKQKIDSALAEGTDASVSLPIKPLKSLADFGIVENQEGSGAWSAHQMPHNFFTALTDNLKQALKLEGVVLAEDKIHQVVSNALWQELQAEALDSQSARSSSKVSLSNPDVFLIFVQEEDAAVYFGAEYIDSANQANSDELQIIVDTAQMLSEKYQTQIKTHQFNGMGSNWSWTTVETILKSSGIMPSDKPNLLTLLQDIESVQLSVRAQATVTSFSYHYEAYQAYVRCGDASQDVFTLDIYHEFQHEQIRLSVEEVVKAFEIEPNRWVCSDLLSTELVLNPKKYFNTTVYSLLR